MVNVSAEKTQLKGAKLGRTCLFLAEVSGANFAGAQLRAADSPALSLASNSRPCLAAN